MHILSPTFEGKSYRIGRQDSAVIVKHSSVSREHAYLRYRGGGFEIEDNESKFGTLVVQRGPLVIEGRSAAAVQIGRTLLSFKIKPVN